MYVKLYEMITGETFDVPPAGVDVNKRMRDALKGVI
jgi:phosphoribosylaminoimidazole-succinocarboxamide synthase